MREAAELVELFYLPEFSDLAIFDENEKLKLALPIWVITICILLVVRRFWRK